MNKSSILFVCILLSYLPALAQQPVRVEGRLMMRGSKASAPKGYVIDKHNASGVLADSAGRFSLFVLKPDTITIGAQGCSSINICFKDSVLKDVYSIIVEMDSLSIKLREVVITSVKTLNEIKDEERTLGVIPNTDLNKTTMPVSLSSLTLSLDLDYIWEQCSHHEKEKRKVSHLQDNQLKESVLKDYLKVFYKAGVITLDPDLFDRFIVYCAFTDDFVKNSSEYDICEALKVKLALFEKENSAAK